MTKLIQRLGVASFALVLATLLSAAPGCIGVSEGDCLSGETCECSGIGRCDKTCHGGDCLFVCKGIGSCSFGCPDGGCQAHCQGEGTCELACPGGDCLMVCGVIGTCEISECPDGSCRIH